MVLVLLSQVSSINAASCGIDKYDFSSIGSGADYYGFQDDYSEIYYLRLCNTVQNLWCQLNSNTANSMACQVSGGDTSSTFSVAANDTSALKWSYIKPGQPTAGVQFVAQNGDYCDPTQKPRAIVGQILCGNSTGTLLPVTENPQCTYNLILTSPLICNEGQMEAEAQIQAERQEIAEKTKAAYAKWLRSHKSRA